MQGVCASNREPKDVNLFDDFIARYIPKNNRIDWVAVASIMRKAMSTPVGPLLVNTYRETMRSVKHPKFGYMREDDFDKAVALYLVYRSCERHQIKNSAFMDAFLCHRKDVLGNESIYTCLTTTRMTGYISVHDTSLHEFSNFFIDADARINTVSGILRGFSKAELHGVMRTLRRMYVGSGDYFDCDSVASGFISTALECMLHNTPEHPKSFLAQGNSRHTSQITLNFNKCVADICSNTDTCTLKHTVLSSLCLQQLLCDIAGFAQVLIAVVDDESTAKTEESRAICFLFVASAITFFDELAKYGQHLPCYYGFEQCFMCNCFWGMVLPSSDHINKVLQFCKVRTVSSKLVMLCLFSRNLDKSSECWGFVAGS